MEFGLSLFGLGPRHYASVAQAAEAAGFDSVWLPDHLVFPETMPATYPYSESGSPQMDSNMAVFDPWVICGAIAQATQTIKMGTSVYILPLRHPLVVARALVTLDHLSNGRVLLGAGVGWLAEEFTAAGLDFRQRGKRMDEIIPLLRRLWTEDTIEHHGPTLDIPPVKFQPKPRKGTIPILVGGASPAALRRAGRLGDGWIEIGTRDFDQLAERLGAINAARAEAGRADLPFDVTLMLRSGGFGDAPDHLERLADMGVTRVIASQEIKQGQRITVAAVTEWIADYGARVIDRARG